MRFGLFLTHRYQLTGLGRAAVLFTKTYGRVLTPGLTVLDPKVPEDVAVRNPLAVAWRRMEHTLEDLIEEDWIVNFSPTDSRSAD